MSKLQCDACDTLREHAPDFVEEGVNDDICASLQNDTGLNPKAAVQHTDCEDLHTANDCLIGRLDQGIDSHEVCDWKDYMHKFVPNLYELIKAIICAVCGLWTNVHKIWNEISKIWNEINNIWVNIRNLWKRITQVSYVGILRLQRTEDIVFEGDRSPGVKQILPFDYNVREGNIPDSVLSVNASYNGIDVKNTLDVPILVNTKLNCTLQTNQPLACCYIVITRDGDRVGQDPFITPPTYDKQVSGESFILQPGETAALGYYFCIGYRNNWFIEQFGGTEAWLKLSENRRSAANQPSYFEAMVTTIVDNS